MRNAKLYLLAAMALFAANVGSGFADIPPTPEQKKKIEETPRVHPKGNVTALGDRAFARTVGAGKAKIVIPRAIYDKLVAEVAAKSGEPAPGAKGSAGIPPIALVFAGLALSGACLYAIMKAPRFRTVAAATLIAGACALALVATRPVQANYGPPHPREGEITIEVPAEGSEVVIYIAEAAPKPAEFKPGAETPK